jgi:hypothetical protein
MRFSLSFVGLVPLCAMLAGCGGSDSGGVASTTPSPTYQTLAQLSGSRTYQTASIGGGFTTFSTGPNSLTSVFNPSATYDYGKGTSIANGTVWGRKPYPKPAGARHF